MTRGVRLYLVGSIVLVSLSGCGRGFFQSAEREPWRAEAEIACLKSGAVKENAEVVRIEPISGPGVCGAEFPLKVAALGEADSAYGFADESPRPPASIGNQPRWPVSQPTHSQQPGYTSPQNYPPPQNDPQNAYPARSNYPESAVRQQNYGAAPNGPISLAAPGIIPDDGEIDLPPEGMPPPRGGIVRSPYPAQQAYPQAGGHPPPDRYDAPYSARPGAAQPPLPALGPARGNPVASVGPVAVKPAATLACPIVSVLDKWLADSVQPAAQRWFGARVVEIKQISAYSCRGMNGSPGAHISEHAFGNALDIAAFTLADGRRITVKEGWHGMPEEQGFLRDVQAAACREFNTVLAPGSNVYHYDHIHVDLMRRASRQLVCEPSAVSGQEIARAQRNPYASRRDTYVTGSLGVRKEAARRRKGGERVNEEDEFQDD
jgi:extensin-like protein